MLWAPLQDPRLCWWQSEFHQFLHPSPLPEDTHATFTTICQFSLEPLGQQEHVCDQDGNTVACGRAMAGGRGWKVCAHPELFLGPLQGSCSKVSPRPLGALPVSSQPSAS